MTRWLRSLLIVALALFAAPRVMAADGELTVLCAADGTRQVILFDFATGAPVEQSVVFETCDHCLTPPIALGATPMLAPLRTVTSARISLARAQHGTDRRRISPSARAPPLWMI